MKNATILLIFISSFTFLNAQTTSYIESPYIEVNGFSEKEIVPDEIYIAITIKERKVGKEEITIEKQETDLTNAITSLGIPIKNLTLSDANADYIRVRWTKKDVISRKEFILKVKNAETLGRVFKKLDDLKIEDAYIEKVSHSKIDSLRQEIKIQAIKDAKKKADYLLEAIGEKTGSAQIVRESNARANITAQEIQSRGSRQSMGSYYIDGTKSVVKTSVVQYKKIKIQTSVYVKFKIQQ